MKVLDLDLDYFLDSPVFNQDHSSDGRVDNEDCIASVWSENRVRDFLEKRLNLSKEKKIPGRILKGHDEALYLWEELIEQGNLAAPFTVIHVDSHADLGFGGVGVRFVLEELLTYPMQYRKSRYCKNFEVDDRYGNIDIGDYLLFAVGFGLVSKIIFCANPCSDVGYIPQEIKIKEIPEKLSAPSTFPISLKLKDNIYSDSKYAANEIIIPLHIIQTSEDINFDGNYAIVSIAQSPNYTPKNADFILEIMQEYIYEI